MFTFPFKKKKKIKYLIYIEKKNYDEIYKKSIILNRKKTSIESEKRKRNLSATRNNNEQSSHWELHHFPN